MNKVAFVFSGQGAQYVGMGKDIAQNFPKSDEILEIASESLGYDLKNLIFNGPEEKLKITQFTQPSILATSVALLQPIMDAGLKASAVSGLSLGEYTAHVYSGSLNFPDAVRLVEKRGKFMQEEVKEGLGGMSAVLGLDEDVVEQCCQKVKDTGYVACANFNSPGQIVISGEISALEAVKEVLINNGAKKVIPLNVSAPFHCAMLKGAGEKLKEQLEYIQINEMNTPVVANVTGDFINDKSEIKDLLVRQVSSTVKWTNCIRRMIQFGIDTFVEIGPGKVLTGLIKKIDSDVSTYNVEDMESLNNTISSLIKDN